MATIIAGNFEGQAHADEATRKLLHAGFPADRITSFFLNPPGQHATYPIGGDRDESPGATEAAGGAMTGAAVGGAIGLAVGLAATPFAGPAAAIGGAGAGAYVGSLAGALDQMSDTPRRTSGRESGILVAVETRSPEDEVLVVDALRDCGARDIERAQGTWRDAQWADFDPLSTPALVSPKVTRN
jgi:hypothetical protein